MILRTTLRVAYGTAIALLLLTALSLLGVWTLNQRDYGPMAVQWMQRYWPGVEVAELRAHWLRDALQLRAEVIKAPGIRIEEMHVGIAWHALVSALSGDGDSFAEADIHIAGARVELIEADDGRWSLTGLALAGDGALDGILDALSSRHVRHFRRLHARDVDLALTLASGRHWDLTVPEAQLWRDADGHWQLAGALRATDRTARASVRAALDIEQRRVRIAVEGLSLPALALAAGRRLIALDDADIALQAWQLGGGDWVADVERLKFSHYGRRLALRDVRLRRRQAHWHVTVPVVDLRSLCELALGDPGLAGRWREALVTMRPEGMAFNVNLRLPADGDLSASVAQARLRADIGNLHVQPWRNVPGLSGIHGAVETGTRAGSVVFYANDLALALPAAYSDSLRVQSLRGDMRWRLTDDRRVRLEIGPVVASADGVDEARLAVMVDVGYVPGSAPPGLRVMAGWKNADVRVGQRYLPKLLPRDAREWLRETVLSGAMPEGGVIYHGVLDPGHREANSVQFYADGADVRLHIADGLPDVERWHGWLTLDNLHARFHASESLMAGESWHVDGGGHGQVDIRIDEPQGRTLQARESTYRISGSAHDLTLHLPWINHAISHISLRMDGGPDAWNFQVRHPRLKARATVPVADAPSLVEIHQLLIPQLDFAQATEGAPVDINGWPDLDVDIKRMTIGRHRIGPAYFQLRSSPDRLSFRHVSIALGGVTLQGQDNGFGDHITWIRRDRISDHSALAFRVDTGSLTSALRSLGAPNDLSGQRASVSGALTWNSHPLDISLKRISGALSFSVASGLLRSDRSSRNLLRAIAALDLDRWVTRSLRGRFVRYNSTGILFDHLHGAVSLRNGRLFAETPIALAGPSVELLLSGHVNLGEKSLDGRLIVGLPASRNAGWLTLLLGSSPAVGTAVIAGGRMFDRWIDRFASVTYRISGHWQDPDLQLDRVFNRSHARSQ